jgi:Ricin-type beta-trefoil lectin domain
MKNLTSTMLSATMLSALIATVCLSVAYAENVEITLVDDLDGILNGYCLDIAGGNENVDPANGLQAHTCYSYQGALGTDQMFDTEQFADNVLYMPEYDVCAELISLEAGSEVGLASCDGNELQSFALSESGTISPTSAPEMCFTAAAESRLGRGSDHQIRDLSLELCSDDLALYQQWRTRATDD